MSKKRRNDWDLCSAAGIEVNSGIPVKTISPKRSTYETIGFVLSRESAIEVARNILIVSSDTKTTGDIPFTVHRSSKKLTINTYRHATVKG